MSEVFPRRNLSAEAEPWGREVEKRIVDMEGIADAAKSGVSGQNRTTASTLGDLARQLARLEDLYRAIPKPVQLTAINNAFGLTSGWQDIARARLFIEEDVTHATVFAVGSAFLTNTTGSVVAGSMRLVAKGSNSPAQPWATFSDVDGFHASINPGFSWGLSVTPGETITVSLQVNPADAATWGVNVSNYATVAALITLTG